MLATPKRRGAPLQKRKRGKKPNSSAAGIKKRGWPKGKKRGVKTAKMEAMASTTMGDPSTTAMVDLSDGKGVNVAKRKKPSSKSSASDARSAAKKAKKVHHQYAKEIDGGAIVFLF